MRYLEITQYIFIGDNNLYCEKLYWGKEEDISKIKLKIGGGGGFDIIIGSDVVYLSLLSLLNFLTIAFSSFRSFRLFRLPRFVEYVLYYLYLNNEHVIDCLWVQFLLIPIKILEIQHCAAFNYRF